MPGTLGDCSDVKVLASLVERLCGSLAEDMSVDSVCAKQVILKIKRSDFTVKQHSVTLLSPTSSATDLADVAVKLLQKEMPATLRLVGVKVAQLTLMRGAADSSSGGIMHRALQASDSAAVLVCPICLKAIVGEPPNVRVWVDNLLLVMMDLAVVMVVATVLSVCDCRPSSAK